MIDLLIAQGSLSESDPPHCVHWMTVIARGPQATTPIGKVVDAEMMLSKAGIPTLMMASCAAYAQGPEALKTFWRDRFGEFDDHDLEALAKLESDPHLAQVREWAVTSPERLAAGLPGCK